MAEATEMGFGQQEALFRSKEPVQSLESSDLQKAAQKAIEKAKSPRRRILSYVGNLTTRLLGADREASKPPTSEQLERLKRLSRILDYETPEYRKTILSRRSSWYWTLQGSGTLSCVNDLYQELADSSKVDFRKDFPVIAKRFSREVKPAENSDPEPFPIIPGGSPLNAIRLFIDEYLEAQEKALNQAR